MARKHVLLISLLLGLAVAVGTLAAVHTTRAAQPSATTANVSSGSLAQRSRALDRVQASLHKALSRRPPKLPRVPSYASTGNGPAVAAPPRIQYVRPAPIVVTTHRSHGDDGAAEHESEGRDD
ncbi:MAG TPA: hypothetical protein VHQ98_04535 [Gaiellaceae bacterium]|jgi:hypothetical protein|nr:hypothetical protein [Gaiellaceae bacterium]